MNEQEIKSLKESKKSLLIAFIVLLNVFLAVLIVSGTVDIQNKIKEGKYIGQEIETKNTITISDTGEIYTKPDLAITTLSVITEAKPVDEAMKENTEKMNKVINFVKGEGVEEKDLQTTNFNIYPRYEYRETEIFSYPPSDKRVLVGYEATQSLQVKIRNMEKIGKIIEGATANGANQVGDLQFTVDTQDDLKDKARKQAIDKAKTKAETLASQLGVNLVRITNFSESAVLPYYPIDLKYAEVPAEGLGGGAPEIETGENKITVTVTITYEVK